MLHLALLGPPEVRLASMPLLFPTRKALALLLYLLVERGMHPREQIMALLWPESPAARGRGVLRTTLSHLRRTLETGAQSDAPRTNRYLVTDGDRLGFDREAAYTLDLDVVTHALTAGRIDAYERTVTLDRGAFLAGFSLPDAPEFDNWVSLQAEFWRQKVDTVYAELSRLYCDRHNTEAAIVVATRWVARDLLHEAAHQRLIQAYLLAGERERAWQAYSRCRGLLDAELGVAPGPVTEELAAQIRRSQKTQRGAAYASRVSAPTAAQLMSSGHTELVQLPFTGRQVEFAQLAAQFQRVAAGEMIAAVIEGEAGIGKSRLATELLQWFALQGGDVIQGRAFEAGGRLPYQALTEALRRRVAAENAPDDLISDVWLAELGRLLPELYERYPDLPLRYGERDGDDETAQTRLMEAIMQLLQAWAAARPLVLFVDDLQWADTTTLDLLLYLSQRLRAEPAALLLVLTLRSEDRAANRALQEWLHSLGRVAPLFVVQLGPLGVAETVQLVAALMKQMQQMQPAEQTPSTDQSDAAADWLFDETAGQPFYLAETVDLLLTQGWLRERAWAELQPALSAQSGSGALLPPGVQEMLAAKLNRLSAQAAHLLAAASVVGRPAAFATLYAIADLAEMDALSALDELLAMRLLIDADQAIPYYQVAHDKIRDVAYQRANPARRHLLHRRALAQLEEARAPAAELAYHAGQAGLDAACFTHSLAAGAEALRLFALDVALAQFGQARSLLERLSVPLERVSQLVMQMGRAYELKNRWQDAREVYAFLVAQAQAARAPHIEATARNRLGLVLGQGLYDLTAAKEHLDAARRMADQAGNMAQVAESALNLAQISMYSWDAQTMVENGQAALEAARRLDLAETEARALNIMAYGYLASGAFAAMGEAAQQAADRFAAQGNRALAADSLSLVCCAATHAGHVDTARAIGQESWEMNLDLDNDWGIANAAIFYAHALLEAGLLGQALTVAQQGRARAQAAGPPSLAALTANTLGDVCYALCAWDAAVAAYGEALTIGHAVDHPFFVEWANSGLCALHLAQQEIEAAAVHAVEAMTTRQRVTGITAFAGFVRYVEVEVLLRTGNHMAAQAAIEQFTTGLRGSDSTRLRLVWLRIEAALMVAARPRDAIQALEDALTSAQTLRLPLEQWTLQRQLAALYAAAGDAGHADAHEIEVQTNRQTLAATIEAGPWRDGFLAA